MRLSYFLQGDMVQASRPTLSEQALAINPFWAGLKNDERNELLSLSLTCGKLQASPMPLCQVRCWQACLVYLCLSSFAYVHVIQLAENMLRFTLLCFETSCLLLAPPYIRKIQTCMTSARLTQIMAHRSFATYTAPVISQTFS